LLCAQRSTTSSLGALVLQGAAVKFAHDCQCMRTAALCV
jgi:hypothetical protein